MGAVVAVFGGCDSSHDATPRLGTATPPTEVMRRVSEAVARTAGYRILVEGHNFVLPQWGGIDGGSVAVRLADGAVSATLMRTGDGEYAMVRYADKTFFQRSSCAYFQRVPGGGASVLKPFLLSESGLLTTTGVSIVRPDSDRVTISGEFSGIGEATLDVDAASYLPRHLTKRRDESGSETMWTFDMWDIAPDVNPPEGSPPDQGPGGNPC